MTLLDVIRQCPGTGSSPLTNHLVSWVWKEKAKRIPNPHLKLELIVSADSPSFLQDNVMFLCVIPKDEWDAAFAEDAKKQLEGGAK